MNTENPTPATPPASNPTTTYGDEDLVYVDPDKNVVVGPVEFNKVGNPKPLLIPNPEPSADDKPGKDGKPRRRSTEKRYFPWGTYKSMKRIYKLEGKPPKVEPTKTLEQVIDIALTEPFWE